MKKGIKVDKQLDGTYIIHLYVCKKRYRAKDFKELTNAIAHYYSEKEHKVKSCIICKRIFK